MVFTPANLLSKITFKCVVVTRPVQYRRRVYCTKLITTMTVHRVAIKKKLSPLFIHHVIRNQDNKNTRYWHMYFIQEPIFCIVLLF